MSQSHVIASCGDYLHHPGAKGTNGAAANGAAANGADLAREEAILQQALENREKEQNKEPTSTCQSGRCNGSPTSPPEPTRVLLPRPSIHSGCSARIEIESDRIAGPYAIDATMPLQPFLEIASPPPRVS